MPSIMTAMTFGPPLMSRLEAFARHSDDADGLTRLYLSPAHKAAAAQLAEWMARAGLAPRIDAIGNVVGRYEGKRPQAPVLMLGSHIDTVRDAGRYDGNFGVLAALACVEAFAAAGERFDFAIEVVGFGDEEGVRFPVTLSGSRAVAGRFDPRALDARDADGIALRDALATFGGDPAAVTGEARHDLLAFVEVHIEQGPVLEAAGLPLGIVTAINGATRLAIELRGIANHAGTVPMALRRDALAGAAEMMLAAETLAAGQPDLVATVGRIDVAPGAVNVIPGLARFTADIRSPSDIARHAAVAALRESWTAIAARRGLSIGIAQTHDAPACRCDQRLIDALAAAVAAAGIRPCLLPSGAGHDAMAFDGICPVCMLFVRCERGISHNPAEAITAEDADVAVRVLADFIRKLNIGSLQA